jgi:hypothetical protein
MFMILRFCHYLWLIDRVLPFKKKTQSTECLICSSGTTSWSIWHPSSISTPLVVCSTTKWDIPPLHAFSSQWRGTICMLHAFLRHKLCHPFNKYNNIFWVRIRLPSIAPTPHSNDLLSLHWHKVIDPREFLLSVLVILASNHTCGSWYILQLVKS